MVTRLDAQRSGPEGGETSSQSGSAVPRRPGEQLAHGHRCTIVGTPQHRTSVTATAPVISALARFFDSRGKEVSSAQVSLHRNPEDVGSVLAFNEGTGRFRIGAGARPALLLRPLVGLPLYGDASTGITLGAAGGYVGLGIERTVTTVAQQKLGINSYALRDRLGSALMPNGKDLPELDYGTLLTFSERKAADAGTLPHSSGDPFTYGRSWRELSGQEIAARVYLPKTEEERITDPRLLVYLERAYARLGGEFALAPIYAPRAICEFVENAKRAGASEAQGQGRLAAISASESSTYRTVELSELRRADVAGDLSHLEGEFSVRPSEAGTHDGSPDSSRGEFECVLASKERLIVTAFTVENGELALITTLGARATVKLRAEESRMVQSSDAPAHVEGIFADVEVSVINAGDEKIVAAAAEIAIRTLHVPPESMTLRKTDCKLFFSPGFNTRGAQQVLCYVPIESLNVARSDPNIRLVSLKNVLNGGETGRIKDLSLLFSATTLLHALPVSERPLSSEIVPSVPTEIRDILASSPRFFSSVQSLNPGLVELARREPILHHLLCKRANLGGVSIAHEVSSPLDKVFFNSALERYVVHKKDPPARIAQLLVHDLWHYEHPDPIPATPSQMLSNEADAVAFSDVWFVTKYGVEQFESDDKRGSLAGLFLKAGILVEKDGNISGFDNARACIHKAITTGELDPLIVKLLREDASARERYLEAIREKLIGYFVRDAEVNCEVLVKAWDRMPHVATLAQKLRPEPEAQPATFEQRLSALVAGTEVATTSAGFNVVKAELAEFITAELYRPALRLRYLYDYALSADRKVSPYVDIEDLTSRAINAQNQLRAALASVTDIDVSSRNVDALRLVAKHRDGIGLDLLMAARRILSESIPIEEAQDLEKREFLPFPTLPFNPLADATMGRRIDAIIDRQTVLMPA
jgi:hypothetical protein